MRIHSATISVLIILLCWACSPGTTSTKWYKGNLHTHSYWSDGDEYPEMIMDWYKRHDYNFVALSDHNILAEGEKWIRVPKSKLYEDGFAQYLQKFGADWVVYKIDTGRTHVKLKTYSEYKPRFEDKDFLVIRSEEITDRFEKKPIHINVTNVQELVAPQGGQSVADVMQRNVDAVLKQREVTGVPMFPHINHPNFYYAISVDDMIALRGERFFEVYNGHPLVNNYGDSLRPGTAEMWDRINIAYQKRQQPLMFGLATDDSHNYHQFGSAYSNAGRGWVMVNADSLSAESIIRAMEAGKFYASTGVALKTYRVENNNITIEVDAEKGVRYDIEFVGVVANADRAGVLKTITGNKAQFTVTPDHLFVRAKVISTKVKTNPFKEGEFEVAWTQPVMYHE